ncbi:MAG: glycyl-tRNA synthetase, glycyl-tRNA synthetase [Parcubacteria group bacterium GW2011_GWC1_44_26]|nr:MAG: glycyl-tRNA synthetase, glycyl-tRNA synthetase [Parcubacteria group bacterium GW2011_GWC1_44_26]
MTKKAYPADMMEKITSLSKRRGFVYPSSEIYGGVAGIYDYGHYGMLLKENIKNEWMKHMIQLRDDVYGLDSAIFMHPQAWVASGHVGGFFAQKKNLCVRSAGLQISLQRNHFQ